MSLEEHEDDKSGFEVKELSIGAILIAAHYSLIAVYALEYFDCLDISMNPLGGKIEMLFGCAFYVVPYTLCTKYAFTKGLFARTLQYEGWKTTLLFARLWLFLYTASCPLLVFLIIHHARKIAFLVQIPIWICIALSFVALVFGFCVLYARKFMVSCIIICCIPPYGFIAHEVLDYIHSSRLHTESDWEKAFDSPFPIMGFAVVDHYSSERNIESLCRILLDSKDESVAKHAYNALWELQDERSIPVLIEYLWYSDNSRDICVEYLNSGHSKLEEAAREWAAEHGYSIEQGATSKGVRKWYPGR